MKKIFLALLMFTGSFSLTGSLPVIATTGAVIVVFSTSASAEDPYTVWEEAQTCAGCTVSYGKCLSLSAQLGMSVDCNGLYTQCKNRYCVAPPSGGGGGTGGGTSGGNAYCQDAFGGWYTLFFGECPDPNSWWNSGIQQFEFQRPDKNDRLVFIIDERLII